MKDYTTPTSEEELVFPGPLSKGASGAGVKRLQEWLTINQFKVAIDGSFGAATATVLNVFSGNPVLDEKTWITLTTPIQIVLKGPQPLPTDYASTVIACAKTHLGMAPVEIGGQNCGPWVRLYMDGKEGKEWPWCAGFVSFIMAEAAYFLGVETPIKPSQSSSVLVANAKKAGRWFVASKIPSDIKAGLFVVKGGSTGYRHTGIAYNFDLTNGVFQTVEGNSNDSGSAEGYEVCSLTRSFDNKDFILLN